jgi:hypothetical protein
MHNTVNEISWNNHYYYPPFRMRSSFTKDTPPMRDVASETNSRARGMD